MTDRRIELAVDVEGTPEEVWQAIATGPGISSWYVPHTMEERQGGAAVASFGEGPEMQIPGRVAAWEPPTRICFDGGEGAGGLAFEWLIEAKEGGTCIVRLVNTGFGSGEEWDAQYDGLSEGWPLFLRNLQLHLQHFRGQAAVSMMPMSVWALPPNETWAALTGALGVDPSPTIGAQINVAGTGAPQLSGTVVDVAPRRISLLIDEPAPGTAIVVVERFGEASGVSVWSYLYGPDAAGIVELDRPRWQQWLDAAAPKG
jgi:uncharacterized protein YndB with AHSA1/START domain